MVEYHGTWRIKPLRSKRKQVYLNSGFAKFEADTFSKFTINVPYAKIMRRQRSKLYERAKKEGWSKKKYDQAVRWEYESRGITKEGAYFTDREAYALLRWFETEWKASTPSDTVTKWVSPSGKKSHHGTDFNHQRLLSQKRAYNSRDDVKQRRAEYRRKNRDKIREAERKRRSYLRSQGMSNK